MAKRENQGLHIALISFVILSVLLIVTTYYFWSNSRHLTLEVDREKAAKTEANSAKSIALAESEKLKTMLNHPIETPVEEIEAQFAKDMVTYAGSLPEVQRNYRELPQHLMSSIQERHSRISDLSADIRTMTADFARQKSELQKALGEAQQELAVKESNVSKIDGKAQADRTDLTSQLAQQAKQADEKISALEADIAEKTAEIETLTTKNEQLEIILADRENKIAQLTNENSFDSPDGKIRFVNTKMGTVYLNLGAADGLRRQVTFSVFGADVNNLYKEEPKGKIEVIRVLSAHESEAKIVEDFVGDPMLRGDVVYTPIWNAGSALRFALVGTLDIDGDGSDDRERFKAMIARNNGKVDAEDVEAADGSRELRGRITRSTRYLVVDGDAPESADEDAASARDVRSQMLNEASSLGVEVIELDRLLEYMGFNGDRRVIPLGSRARAEDFRAKPVNGLIPSSSPQTGFRKRGAGRSAYSRSN